MNYRGVIIAALLSALFAPAKSHAQSRNPLDLHDRVLDLLFPSNVESKPYIVKLVLRFDDDASQLAIVVYPGGDSEVVRSTLDGMNASELSQLISTKLTEHPNVQAVEIAAAVKVRTTRYPVQYKTLEPTLNALKAIKISPFLNTRIGFDEVILYDFWFDSGQESVHYKIFGHSTLGDPQDNLAQWMVRFREASKNLAQRKS